MLIWISLLTMNFQHHVEPHAEALSLDLALGRIADPMTHFRIVEFPVLDDFEGYRSGVAIYGQIAFQGVAVTAESDILIPTCRP
jgi:hypothetical protein